MKKIIILSFILLAFCLGNITIERHGSSVIAFSDTNKNILFFSSEKNTSLNSLTMQDAQVRMEEDKPMELHSLWIKDADIGNSQADSFWLTHEQQSDPILVAVIDSGMDLQNNSLQPYVYINSKEIPDNGIDDDQNGFIDDVQGYNFIDNNGNVQDDYGHGILISGIVARNSMGTVKILPIKAFNSQGQSSQFIIACAINYAVNMGVKIINCSFGYYYTTEILQLAIENALSKGVIIIASAGNYGEEQTMYPAGFSGVVGVSSLDSSDHLASFSNYGSFISASCLGMDVLTTYFNNQFKKVSGTSMSAGYISGILGYLMKTSGDNHVSSVLYSKCTDIVDPLNNGEKLAGWDKYTGYGKLDISSIIHVQTSGSLLSISNFLNYPNPVINNNGTEFGYYLNSDANVQLYVYDLSGKRIWSKNITAGNTGAKSGYNKVFFDCRNTNGNVLANDTYIAIITALNGTQKSSARTLLAICR
ncbi:MAG: S8 family serine peptidase [Candidatus Margulisbacteria bacterium]|nr:S8 family serine peptidase [Candidatus Margulisiibacteriota bacterium]